LRAGLLHSRPVGGARTGEGAAPRGGVLLQRGDRRRDAAALLHAAGGIGGGGPGAGAGAPRAAGARRRDPEGPLRHSLPAMSDDTRASLPRLGLPAADAAAPPPSEKRFPDGAEYRIEIPSTEGPRALRAVVEAARRYGVTVHRVSQGSGIMLLT